MEIFLLCDDDDDSAIFLDAINEIDPGLKCTIMSSKEQIASVLEVRKELPRVFLDINNLPEKFTKELITCLRSTEKWKTIKILVYSNSFEIVRKHEELTQLGVDDYIVKTNDLSYLRTSILNSLK